MSAVVAQPAVNGGAAAPLFAPEAGTELRDWIVLLKPRVVSLVVFTGLVGLWIAPGQLNPVIALGIACFKAVIVILFFMHAKYQSRLIKMTIASGFFVFLVLIVMTMSDYISRAWGMW